MVDGYCYFDYSTGKFYIDYTDNNGVLKRMPLNAKSATQLDVAPTLNAVRETSTKALGLTVTAGEKTSNAIALPEATSSQNGIMSAADKAKLDGISSSADAVSFSASATSGNKIGTITINGANTILYAPIQTTVSGNAGTATTLQTARTIDGVSFNGSTAISHYGTCSTAAATAAKTVALTGFSLVTGARIAVKFTVTNTASNPTLNVNGTGAKAVQYRGSAISAGYLGANRTYEFVYDGTYWALVGDIDTNTTYATASSSANGLMSSTDKAKLDAITASADAVSFTPSLTSGTKVGTININGTDTALYAPTNTDTHYTTYLKVGASATAISNAAATNGNVYLNLMDNSTIRDSHKIVGSGATTVTSDANGVITISSTNTTYTSLKNPYALTIQGNGTSLGSYDGSAAKTINITYSNVGAAAASHTHTSLNCLGAANPESERTSARGGVYSYITNASYNTGAPTTYTSVIGFGAGVGGHTEIASGCTSNRGLWYRNLRDTIDNWYDWYRVLDQANYTNYTVTKTGSGASGTWGISISGNAATATCFNSNRTIALTGDVTGSASANGSSGWSIAATIGEKKVTNAMLAGSIINDKLVYSTVEIAGNTVSLGGKLDAGTLRTSLGLSNAMHFIGVATVAISDGSTTDPQIKGYTFTSDRLYGDVIIDKDSSYEYVWTTNQKWERLGPDGSYKTVQTAVASPSASGTEISFIDTISQNANGVINATRKKILTPVSGSWFNAGMAQVGTGGVMEIGRYIDFHGTSASTNDYDVRIDAGTTAAKNTLYLPDVTGQIVVHSNNTAVGSASVPVYIAESGAATACTASSLFSAFGSTAGASGETLSITVAGQTRTVTLDAASASQGGVITTGAQTIAGAKTFSNDITMSGDAAIVSANVGGLFYKARDCALMVHNTSIASSSFAPIYSLKEASGDFSAGVLHSTSGGNLQWIYVTDTNYNANSNTYTNLMSLTKTGALTAVSFSGNGANLTSLNASNISSGTLPVARGGTGATTFTSGAALIGNGTGAIATRSITNNTSATAVAASTNLITANTLYYHKGNSNLVTVGTVTSGTWNASTIGAAYGGTGCTSLNASANALINSLTTGSATPFDADYYICQSAGGGTTTTTYHRRPTSALWAYINGKLGTSAAGSSTLPVYWNGSKPVACSTTLGVSVTGNAATATKLATARTIGLGYDFYSSGVSFDGSGNITLAGMNNYNNINSSDTNTYPYHRIAYASNISGTYQDKDAIFEIRHKYNAGPYGRFKVSFRTNASSNACQVSVKWLYRYGMAADSVTVAYWGVTGNNCYVDVFYKTSMTYARAEVIVIRNLGNFTIVSSNEAASAASHTECWASIADAATALHGQAYTGTSAGTDAASVNYANSAGAVAWSNVTSKPSYYDAKAIKSITRDGTTFTYTCLDGSTGTFTQQDNNTTYTLSGLGGVGTVSASGTSPLTLSASKSGTAVTISGSMTAASASAAGYVSTGTQTFAGAKTFSSALTISATTASSSTSTGALIVKGGIGAAGNIYGAKVYNAVWNDYAEFRKAETIEPGRVVIEDVSGEMKVSSGRLQAGASIVSDTFGHAMGETDECKTPLAVAGRALAYTNENRNSYPLGAAVCTGPNGTVSLMTREEIMMYPERIVGTVSEIPNYETWGSGNVKVDGRIWIKVR